MSVQTAPRLDPDALRADFPILGREVNGRPLVYLDNAATTQKPRQVIDRIRAYYEGENANIHRGVHTLSQEATDDYEAARERVARFIGASDSREVIFVRGCTEGINLVASSWGQSLEPGDEVVVTALEHHSNLVPWQLACERAGAILKIAPVTDEGALDMDALPGVLSERTRLVSTIHISNALGTVVDVAEVVRQAKAVGALVLVDGAQAAPHARIDVAALGCDFYTFSGHKVYGPMGIGALWGRAELLDAMPPYQGGGDMIETVTYQSATWNSLPHKFEAGTPNVPGVVGLAAALDWLDGIGLDAVAEHEADLLAYATERVTELGARVVGTAARKAGALSFVFDGAHPYDVGTLLDQMGVAVRTGHHCAHPLMRRMGVEGTIRASLAAYTTREEIDTLARSLERALRMVG
jgi:cysteine desulfurase/selenocysteine lyase